MRTWIAYPVGSAYMPCNKKLRTVVRRVTKSAGVDCIYHLPGWLRYAKAPISLLAASGSDSDAIYATVV